MVKKSGKRKLYEKSIKNWPEDERPREKLFKSGEHTLSNTELLAILLRSGVRGHSAIDLARSVLSKFKTFRDMSHTDIRDWQEFKGLGQAKIAQIRAALEIGRRFREDEVKENQPKIELLIFLTPEKELLIKQIQSFERFFRRRYKIMQHL